MYKNDLDLKILKTCHFHKLEVTMHSPKCEYPLLDIYRYQVISHQFLFIICLSE